MSNFEERLQAELDKEPFVEGLDDGQYNDGQRVGFEAGARWVMEEMKKEVNRCGACSELVIWQ